MTTPAKIIRLASRAHGERGLKPRSQISFRERAGGEKILGNGLAKWKA